MYIFTCDNTFEDMMCCIYHAWEKALKVGHGCVRLEKRGEEQISLFDEYIYIEYNEEEYKKVVRSIKHKISEEAYVMRIKDIRRKVLHETRYFMEFARFNSIDNKVYVCHLEPESDVIYEVSLHFADRMPSENWLIIDDNRKKSVVHTTDGQMYIRYFTDYDMSVLAKTEDVKDEYTDMWKIFFETIAIKHRHNPECQRNLMPVWMRKHVTEFQ